MTDFVRVADLAELPPGRVKAVRVEGMDLAIYNVAGKIYATFDGCPHQGYPLSKGELSGRVIKCDLHRWRFDLETGEFLDNPGLHLRRFETKVEDGGVFLRLS